MSIFMIHFLQSHPTAEHLNVKSWKCALLQAPHTLPYMASYKALAKTKWKGPSTLGSCKQYLCLWQLVTTFNALAGELDQWSR
jgi:hypothetical protein